MKIREEGRESLYIIHGKYFPPLSANRGREREGRVEGRKEEREEEKEKGKRI